MDKNRQLTNIVSDLLVLSTLESGKAPAPQPVSLKESIESALRSVVNPLDNAITFNRPGGEVRVEIAREAAAPRSACATRATGGAGLGLAIVKHAVEQMGGSVSVESRLGQGSVFTVALPPADCNVTVNQY